MTPLNSQLSLKLAIVVMAQGASSWTRVLNKTAGIADESSQISFFELVSAPIVLVNRRNFRNPVV